MFLARFFSILSVLVTFLCFAQNETVIDETILEDIITNESFCVKGYAEGKIYLKEDKIYLLENRIHLVLNEYGDYVQLSKLESDLSGCFVPASGLLNNVTMSRRNPQIFNNCPDCGEPYFIKCKNPSCPGNIARAEQKRQEENNRKDKNKPKR